MAQKKKYTNLTGQVLRYSEGGRDFSVAPGGSFTAEPSAYTEGLVGRGLASAKDVGSTDAPADSAPEQAAGPTAAPDSPQDPATTAPPAAVSTAKK